MSASTLILSLLACYGVVFFVQNKLWRPEKLPSILDKLLKCSYCLGFWAGLGFALVAFLLDAPEFSHQPYLWIPTLGFASAAFSYGIDTVIRWFEEVGS